MKKIILILQREYYTRVRKKSFIVMTLLGPLLLAAMLIVPIYIAQKSDSVKEIAVVDESKVFLSKLPSNSSVRFVYVDENIDTLTKRLDETNYSAILHIPNIGANRDEQGDLEKLYSTIRLISNNEPGLNTKLYIENVLKRQLEDMKLTYEGIDKEILKRIYKNVNIKVINLKESGSDKQSYTELKTAVGYFCGILIYMFIFMYGALVMRGVIEEKTNRIVEVIVSSVKPFQLMMGKIVGVAMVGLTQFIIWIVLTYGVFIVGSQTLLKNVDLSASQKTMMSSNKFAPINDSKAISAEEINSQPEQVKEVFKSLYSINYGLVITMFLFYFLFGYLLYAALFASIGSAVDNETDTQQFMVPVSIPLLLSIFLGQFVMNNPSGPVAFWLSIFPLTSPIIMMIRIPFGVPYFDLILSASLLILGFLATTWLSSKIYKTGILLYGKKFTYGDIWKWLKY